MPRRVGRRSKGSHAPARPRNQEPLAEGIVPLRGNGQRDLVSMSDDELVDHAKKFIKKNGISRRKKLEKADSGLYPALRRRKLLDDIGLEKKRQTRPHGFFSRMSDDMLVAFTKKFIEEKKIRGRGELVKADSGLYSVLRKRNLLNRIGLEAKRRRWNMMSDEEIIEYAKDFLVENNIRTVKELQKKNNALIVILYRRGLSDKICLERAFKDWTSISDKELIEHTQRFLDKKGISNRTGLKKANAKLHDVLIRRKLLDSVKFREKRAARNWSSMNDEALVNHARGLVSKHGVMGRYDLQKLDKGLYAVLLRRELLDKVNFEADKRAWRLFEDSELVEYAQRFIDENGIKNKCGLRKADKGLQQALQRRKLLDRLEFKWIRRNWASMSDGEFVEHAKRFVKERGIKSRWGLGKADRGVYQTLQKRKLLDLVFADVEQAKEREEAQALFDGLMEFGGAG